MKKINKKGFTLVELLLVIAIIGILAAVLFVSLGNQRERARTTTFKENMRGLVTAYTACADGGGTIYVGTADGGGAACIGGTSGITSNGPTITQCNDASGYVQLNVGTTGETSGDAWSVTASCDRSTGTGSCVANCTADGCIFTGECN